MSWNFNTILSKTISNVNPYKILASIGGIAGFSYGLNKYMRKHVEKYEYDFDSKITDIDSILFDIDLFRYVRYKSLDQIDQIHKYDKLFEKNKNQLNIISIQFYTKLDHDNLVNDFKKEDNEIEKE
jgi:hypothetical protein